MQCSSRAADQVNVRASRLGLDEIETRLLHRPNLRGNANVVRRDKNEDLEFILYIRSAKEATQEITSLNETKDNIMIGMLIIASH